MNVSSPTNSSLLLLALAVIFVTSCVQAKDVYYVWELDSILENDLSPDCMNVKDARRYSFLAERSFPGPLIEVEEGDIIHVQVTNENPVEGVSLHWHGIHQRGTPYMDGPAGLTQCPLGPHQSQEYVFEAYPPGTHYWHAHGSLALADGLNGPMIVHPKSPQESEPFSYDEERLLFLQEWYVQTSTQQWVGLNNWPFTWVGNPNSILINGKGVAPECLSGGASFNVSTKCLETCLLSPMEEMLNVTHVQAGKTYRFRIINAAQLVMLNLAITNHTMTIVQVEGTSVEPITGVDSLDIAPGQRYDVLVTMDQAPGTYWIETTVRERNMEVKGQALLHYEESALVLPEESDAPQHAAWNETIHGVDQEMSLKAITPSRFNESAALTATDVTRYILVGTQNQVIIDGNPAQLVWGVNNITNIKGKEPLVATSVRAAQELGWPAELPDTLPMPLEPPFAWNYTEFVDSPGGPGAPIGTAGRAVVTLEEGAVVEFVLQNARALNGVAEFHPWHMHGHSFWVVGQGDGIYDPEVDVDTYNLENPVLRDTVNLWPLQWVAIRVLADNPGVWFVHCHLTSHVLMGMGLSMVVQPDKLEALPENVKYCAETELDEGDTGNADVSTTTEGGSTGTGTGSSTTAEGSSAGTKSNTTGEGGSAETATSSAVVLTSLLENLVILVAAITLLL